MIGREREHAAVCDLLLRSDVPIVTVTGPGGVGKTRLALHVAADLTDRFADGARFIPLSAINDAELRCPRDRAAAWPDRIGRPVAGGRVTCVPERSRDPAGAG